MRDAAIGLDNSLRQLRKLESQTKHGETALILATNQRNHPLMEMLLRAGKNPDAKNYKRKYFPLACVILYDHQNDSILYRSKNLAQ